MSYSLVYQSKTTRTMKGRLGPADFRTAVPTSHDKQAQQRDSRTFVSAVSIQLSSGKDEDSALSSSANESQQNASEATGYHRELNKMHAGESSLISGLYGSISKRESTLMASSSTLQKEAISSSKRESSSLMSMASTFMSQKEASSVVQSRERKETSMISTEYSSESKRAETNLMSLKSSSASEKRSRLMETSLVSRNESSFSSRMSSFRSNESSLKSVESSSTWQKDSSVTSQEGSAMSATKPTKVDEDGKGWYYELLLRLENLSWNYQNLEAEYAFLEKLMVEQKRDLKSAQSWAQSMKKQMPTADVSQVSYG